MLATSYVCVYYICSCSMYKCTIICIHNINFYTCFEWVSTHCLLQTPFCIGIPSCPTDVNLDSSTLRNNDCDVSLTWQQPANTPPVTSTTVTYCPTSSLNCRNSVSLTCTSPCTISGLLNDTEYLFTVITNNNCGSPTGCTGNSATHSE